MFFSIIFCTIKLIINLIIIGIGLFKKILKRIIFKERLSKRKFLRFSFFIKLWKQIVNIIFNTFLLMFDYLIFTFSRFTYFFQFIFFGINLSISILYSIPTLFVFYLLNYCLFSFFKLLKCCIFTIQIIILRNFTGFFIAIKKPVKFLNIIINLFFIFNIIKLMFNLIKIIYYYIKNKYIILVKNYLFLKLLPIYLNILRYIGNNLNLIFILFLKVNLINLIKKTINLINKFINLIFKIMTNLTNLIIILIFSIPIINYIFFKYYSKKYFRILIKFINTFLNNIKLIIIFTPKWVYYTLLWFLKNIYCIYTSTIYCTCINTINIFQKTYKFIFKQYKIYFYKFKIFYKFSIKNIFILFKNCLKHIFKQFCIFFKFIKNIYFNSFAENNYILSTYTELMHQIFLFFILNILIIKNLFKFLIIISYFINIIFGILIINCNSCIFFITNIIFKIIVKTKRRIKYIIQKTYLRLTLWFRQKIMLFLTKRQQFYFKRYYILRRARRRVNIIRRYFRLHSRYLAWNIFQHSYSLIFFFFRNIIYYGIKIFIKVFDKLLSLDFNLKNTISVLIQFIHIILSSILYSLINIVFNIIPFTANNIVRSANYIIAVNGIILNTILIKLYNISYLILITILNVINFSIVIIIYIIQVTLLICTIILNNIINIFIIIYVIIQYIIARLLEISVISYLILYYLSNYIIYLPLYWVYYTIYYMIYSICIFPFLIIKQIIAIYFLILFTISFTISLITVLPIKHILKLIQKIIKYVYYQKQYDLVVDRYVLKYIRLLYLMCYAIIGLAFYGTLILIVDSIKYCLKRKKKITLLIFLLTLVYIYSDEKNINELYYCITLTPEQLIYYLIDLIISLTNNFTLLLIELKYKFYTFITIDSINLCQGFLDYLSEFCNKLENEFVLIKIQFYNVINLCYNSLINIPTKLYLYICDLLTDTNLETTFLFKKVWNMHDKLIDTVDEIDYYSIYLRIIFLLEYLYTFNFNHQIIIYINDIFLNINNYLYLENLYYPSIKFNYDGIFSSFNIKLEQFNPFNFSKLILNMKSV